MKCFFCYVSKNKAANADFSGLNAIAITHQDKMSVKFEA